jgi:hypothetical protein
MPNEVGVMKSKMPTIMGVLFFKMPGLLWGKEFHLVKNPPKYTCKFLLGLEVVCFVEHLKDAPLVLWYYNIVKIKLWDIPSAIHINN